MGTRPSLYTPLYCIPPPVGGDKERAQQTRLASQAIGLEGLRREEGSGAPCAFADLPAGWSRRRAPRSVNIRAPCTGAPLVWRPARKGLRTAILGSCTETRPCSEPRPISEAHGRKHIPRPPSSSAYIHYEPQKLIPAPSFSLADGWVLGTRPRMTVE